MTTDPSEMKLVHLCKQTDITAPIDVTFEAVLAELGPEGQFPGGRTMPMVLEAWPGGRWFRDLGNNSGHFWGTVQVIKPPTLLEISGPFFMSSPATNHLQYRLTANGDTTRLVLTHRGYGQFSTDFFDGADKGWQYRVDRAKAVAEKLYQSRVANR